MCAKGQALSIKFVGPLSFLDYMFVAESMSWGDKNCGYRSMFVSLRVTQNKAKKCVSNWHLLMLKLEDISPKCH